MSQKQLSWDNVDRCSALTNQGTPCQKQAGWGTTHSGEGVCILHTDNPADYPKKSKRLKFANKQLADRINQLLYDDDTLDLKEELAYARYKLEAVEADPLVTANPALGSEASMKILATIAKLVERIQAAEKDKKSLVPLAIVQAILLGIGQTVREALPPEYRNSFLSRFQTIVRPELLKLPMGNERFTESAPDVKIIDVEVTNDK